jgi:SAM-dependent methyltransferase
VTFHLRPELYDTIVSFKDYAREAARVRELVGERRTLLDVACGTGKHLEVLRAWYEVEGVDLDRDLLDVARRRLPGVPLHHGDMRTFDLGEQFDAVTCLFSAIGYAGDTDGLRAAVARMAAHLAPDGILIVEPWIEPDAWIDGNLDLLAVDEDDLKLARVTRSSRRGNVSIMDFHYLIVTREGAETFEERHEPTLFTREEYGDAFRAAGLAVARDEEGLIGRGLYIGRRDA